MEKFQNPRVKENIPKVSKQKAQFACKGKIIRLRSDLSATLDTEVEQHLKALWENQGISLSNSWHQYRQLEPLST